MAGRIEHVRALHHSKKGELTASQAALDDAQMLFSIHTYARLNAQPGLALERGREAFDAARAIGDRWLEALAAGGMAMTCLQVGGSDECGAWLDRAVTAAMAVASTSMARRLEMWRGAHAAARDDIDAMDRHYRRAADLAGQGSIGERCEALATLAFEYARIAAFGGDNSLMERARVAAEEALEAGRQVRGRLPTNALAHAALSLAAGDEGDTATAAEEARSALDIDGETHLLYFVAILWAAARALILGDQPEAASLSAEIIGGMYYLSMSMSDPEIRAKWFSNPIHAQLAEIVGFDLATLESPEGEHEPLDDDESDLLRALASGSVGAGSEAPTRVGYLLAKLGVDTENEAIQYAIKSGVAWR
jgi:tetratricopeptide (TPR) repeat protein